MHKGKQKKICYDTKEKFSSFSLLCKILEPWNQINRFNFLLLDIFSHLLSEKKTGL